MGADFDYRVTEERDLEFEDVLVWFDDVQETDRAQNGMQYSGTIGMAAGLEAARAPRMELNEALEWLQDNCEKWEEALAIRLHTGEWVVGAICAS